MTLWSILLFGCGPWLNTATTIAIGAMALFIGGELIVENLRTLVPLIETV